MKVPGLVPCVLAPRLPFLRAGFRASADRRVGADAKCPAPFSGSFLWTKKDPARQRRILFLCPQAYLFHRLGKGGKPQRAAVYGFQLPEGGVGAYSVG